MGIALLAAGCFNPSVKNGGFACSPDVENACPTGFFCVNQRCVDHPGVSTDTGDMSLGGDGADLATMTPDQPADLAVAPPSSPDLASPPVSPPDMAKPVAPPDLSMPNTCAHDVCTTGTKLKANCSACASDVCAQDAYCCSTSWDDMCVSETDDYCDIGDQC